MTIRFASVIAVLLLAGQSFAADSRAISFPASQPTAAPPKNPQIDTTGVLTINAAVAFSTTATSDSGNAITYSWDFGDGSPLDTRQKPTHIYTRPATYTVTLTIKEAGNDTPLVKTLSAVITDAIKAPRFLAGFDFRKSGKDNLLLQGTLKVPTGDAVKSKTINCDIGGILFGFTLDAKGAAKITTNSNVVSGIATTNSNVSGKFNIFVKHRPSGVEYTDAKFTLKMKDGVFLPALADEFVFNRDAEKEPVRIVAKMTIVGVSSNGNGSSLYQSTLAPSFTAKKDLKGKLR
jgi:hypothetical protein